MTDLRPLDAPRGAGSPRGLRIAVTGPAGAGKSTLAAALAAALGLPLLAEEVRAHLAAGAARLDGRPFDEVARELVPLWEARARAEATLPAFVADTCALDLVAQAVHHGVFTASVPPEAAALPPFAEEAARAAARYDAILLLPWGALPYEQDGIRAPDPRSELRYELVLEALLARHAAPGRVHRLPPGLSTREARLAWARALCEAARVAAAAPGPGGRVWLVGAGPGDPSLLTLRAVELLRSADVVAYDELVPRALLAFARPDAELLAVGRRRAGPRAPVRLHPAVLDRARAGRTVVRLKAGDPFVFGRGGEEAEELRDAGIPCEVVPGISAALGAAARARIPLTHRGIASDVTFATGHDLLRGPESKVDPERLAGAGTLALYMATHALGPNLERLILLGRAPETPAAWIMNATRPDERIVTGTLATLAAKVAAVEGDGPSLVLVGEVVAVGARLRGEGDAP